MSKSNLSSFVVFRSESDWDRDVLAVFSNLDAAKDYLMSDILCEVLDGASYDAPYSTCIRDLVITEYVGEEIVNHFAPQCEGYDYSIDKVTSFDKLLATLDIACVTTR